MIARQTPLIRAGVEEEIRQFNLAALKGVTYSLVKYRLANAGRSRNVRARLPTERDLLLLHRTATLFLVPRPGRYRRGAGGIYRDRLVIHRGTAPRRLKQAMREMFLRLASIFERGDALDVAAYALWRITEIHPFADGNGRTASAFAYACLCLGINGLPPGRETMLDRLLSDAAPCRRILRRTSRQRRRAPRGSEASLKPLKSFLDALLLQQIKSAHAKPV